MTLNSAGLDASGYLEYIGIAICHSDVEGELVNYFRKNVGYIHISEERTRQKKVQKIKEVLNALKPFKGKIHMLSVSTGFNEVKSLLEERMPSHKKKNIVFDALAKTLIRLFSEYNIKKYHVDDELRPIFNRIRQYPTRGYLCNLADVVAWLDFQIGNRKWTLSEEYKEYVTCINIQKDLERLCYKKR